jgi:hypothetical protein
MRRKGEIGISFEDTNSCLKVGGMLVSKVQAADEKRFRLDHFSAHER